MLYGTNYKQTQRTLEYGPPFSLHLLLSLHLVQHPLRLFAVVRYALGS